MSIVQHVHAAIEAAVASVTRTAIVVEVDGSAVRVQPFGQAAEVGFWPCAPGWTPEEGDEVVMLRIGAGWYVLGDVVR
jgi:hypothetical protein